MLSLRPLLVMLLAAAAPPAGDGSAFATVEISRGGTYLVDGGFEVAASPAQVWAVLSDYEALPRFVPGIRQSHVRKRGLNSALVEQDAVVNAWFVSDPIPAAPAS